MSFWDHVKPAKRPPVAVAVEVAADGKGLTLRWDDGATTVVAARTLRQACPCAECVEELTGRRTLDPESVPPDLRILATSSVGNYALTFTFSDAHRIGIYNWTWLRELSKPTSR